MTSKYGTPTGGAAGAHHRHSGGYMHSGQRRLSASRHSLASRGSDLWFLPKIHPEENLDVNSTNLLNFCEKEKANITQKKYRIVYNRYNKEKIIFLKQKKYKNQFLSVCVYLFLHSLFHLLLNYHHHLQNCSEKNTINQSCIHPLPTGVVSLQFHNNFQDFQGTLTHKNQKPTRCTVLSSNIWESERGYGEQVSAKPVSDLDGWTREWFQNDSKWPNKPTKLKVGNCSSDSLDLCGMWFHVISRDLAWIWVILGDSGRAKLSILAVWAIWNVKNGHFWSFRRGSNWRNWPFWSAWKW